MQNADNKTDLLFFSIRSKQDVSNAAEKIISAHEILDYIAGKGKYSVYASWSLRIYAQKYPAKVSRYLSGVTEILETSHPGPVLRNLSGILCDHPVPENLEDRVVSLAFNLLDNHKLPVAVHANALLIACKICRKYPDLQTEINHVMERHPFKEKASLRTRINRSEKYKLH